MSYVNDSECNRYGPSSGVTVKCSLAGCAGTSEWQPGVVSMPGQRAIVGNRGEAFAEHIGLQSSSSVSSTPTTGGGRS